MANKKIEISLENCCIKVKTLNAVLPNAQEYYSLSGVKSIVPLFEVGVGLRTNGVKTKSTYPYNDRKQVVISYTDENGSASLTFDLESVDNQPGWTLDLPGLIQAVTDISAWIASCTAAGAVVGLATETTLQVLAVQTVRTPVSTLFNGAGALATTVGIRSVTFTCVNGVESVNGIVRGIGTYTFESPRGEDVLPAIPFDPLAGTIITDEM